MDHASHAPLRPVVTASLTLGAAVGVFAVAFGVGAVAAGGSVAQACAMSLLVFTGASQFSAVSVVAAGGSTARRPRRRDAPRRPQRRLRAGDVPLIGGSARHPAPRRPADDRRVDGDGHRPADIRAQRAAFWITGISVFVFWNLGTLVGALAGSAIDPQTYGLDAAFPAGFVAMVAPHLRHRLGLLAGLLGATICLVLIPFTPVGVPILCASAAILLGVPARTQQETAELPGTAGVP